MVVAAHGAQVALMSLLLEHGQLASVITGRVAPFGLLLPVLAVMSSVVFLGDPVTPPPTVSGLLAISGVAITT